MPKISFIIPVYNVDKFLRNCLDSVLNQTLKDIEILCIEDVSKDGSLEILKEYEQKDQRIKVIQNERNMGLSETRNIGIEAASGDYIWFVDSDDRILGNNAAEQLYRHMENENLDVLMFETKQEFENTRLKEKYSAVRLGRNFDYHGIWNGKKIFALQIENNDFNPCVWMMMYRRIFLIENHLKFASIIHEDLLYSPYILEVAERVKCIHDQYYVYYRREDSISTQIHYATEIAVHLYVYNELTALSVKCSDDEFQGALQKYAGILRSNIRRYFCRWLWKKEGIDFVKKDNEVLLKKIICEDLHPTFGDWSGTIISNIPKRHLFLYEYVQRNAKIVLYGLGRMGTDYLKQIEATGYCQILAVSDRSDDKLGVYAYPFLYPEEIGEAMAADYFVIAVDNEYTANDMYHAWVKLGVPPQKIVSIFMRHTNFPLNEKEYKQTQKIIEKRKEETNNFYIAVQILGGIGDCIISLAFCRRLSRYSDKITMDIYVDVEEMQSVFGNEIYVRNIVLGREIFTQKYDLVIALRHRVHIVYAEQERIKAFSCDLWSQVIRTKELRRNENMDDESGQDLSILTRARKLGRNRYTMLGDGEVWKLKEDMSRITLNQNFKDEFDFMELGRYITINCSSGNQKALSGKKQIKVWSMRKYEDFCKRFKQDFPGIEVIQIGDKDAEKIGIEDRLISDKSLELIKYILKNSLLHIDGEGGMVHLATQLQTKCIVLFGPTPSDYYGYQQNINLCAGDCHGCMGITPDWYTKCPLYDRPRCMNAITPEMVMNAVKGVLEN